MTKGGGDVPEGMEAGNMSDDERDGGKKKEKEKKKKLKKKRKVLNSVPIGSLCYSTDNLSHKYLAELCYSALGLELLSNSVMY